MNEKTDNRSITCENCGKNFTPKRKWHRFCSTRCRVEAYHKRKLGLEKLRVLEERIERIEKKLWG